MPVNIMYMLDVFETPQGGTEGQVLQLLKNIDRSRYFPSVALLRRSEFVERNGLSCPVTFLDINKIARISAIAKLLRFGIFLRRKDYRIVHCFFNDVSLIAPSLLRMFGLRIVVSRRDMGIWYTPLKLFVLRLNSRFVHRYAVNSHAVKRVVRDREHAAERKITVIYNGYFSPPDAKAGTDAPSIVSSFDEGPIIGIVANVRRVKRIDTLIRAFGAIKQAFQHARVVVVGDFEHDQARDVFKELKALAAQLGIAHRVVFTGGVEDPRPYINLFTVAVLCSESEGFSNSLVEYMLAGRPVICTNTGGNPELVLDGMNGFLVPVGDFNALADRLAHLLSDRTLAQRLGENAREFVTATFPPGRMLREQMACYDEVLA